MKHIVMVLGLLGIGWTSLASESRAQSTDTLVARLAVKRAVIAVTAANRQWRAGQLRNDVGLLDSLLADDWTTTETASPATGRSDVIQNKSSYLGDVKSGERSYEAITEKDPAVWVVGTTAVVTGASETKGYLKDAEVSGTSQFLRTYAIRQGRWRMIAATTSIILP